MYWFLVHLTPNPDPKVNCIIENLSMACRNMKSIKWGGCELEFETITFDDINEPMTVKTVLLPLGLFEDLIRYHTVKSNNKDTPLVRLGNFLKSNSLANQIK